MMGLRSEKEELRTTPFMMRSLRMFGRESNNLVE